MVSCRHFSCARRRAGLYLRRRVPCGLGLRRSVEVDGAAIVHRTYLSREGRRLGRRRQLRRLGEPSSLVPCGTPNRGMTTAPSGGGSAAASRSTVNRPSAASDRAVARSASECRSRLARLRTLSADVLAPATLRHIGGSAPHGALRGGPALSSSAEMQRLWSRGSPTPERGRTPIRGAPCRGRAVRRGGANASSPDGRIRPPRHLDGRIRAQTCAAAVR